MSAPRIQVFFYGSFISLEVLEQAGLVPQLDEDLVRFLRPQRGHGSGARPRGASCLVGHLHGFDLLRADGRVVQHGVDPATSAFPDQLACRPPR